MAAVHHLCRPPCTMGNGTNAPRGRNHCTMICGMPAPPGRRTQNEKKIAEYIQKQLQDDIAEEQISMREFVDPFTGELYKKA